MEALKETIIEGRHQEVEALVRQALDSGAGAHHVLEQGLIAGMSVVGERFRAREIFLPDVLLAARAMHRGLALLEPLLGQGGAARRGKVVLGTVQGDLHDIGKNLVGIMLRGAGFEVIDLGTDVSPQAFVEAVRTHEAQIVGMSALLTTTMPGMEKVVEALREAGLGQVKTLVGGAPLSQAFAEEIGASAYGYDAARAVELAQGMAG